MKNKSTNRNPIIMLRSAANTFAMHPIVLYPFVWIILLQLFIVEIIFFAPRFPLSHFFAPLITYFNGPQYLHYPHTISLLVNWFQGEFVQYPIYILVTTFFSGAAALTIYMINCEKTVNFKIILTETLKSYVHLIIAASLSAILIFYLSSKHGLYGLIIQRTFKIQSTTGPFYLIKQIILATAPYCNLIMITFAISLFLLATPIIVIDKKNVISALITNFKILFGSFFQILLMMLLPTLLYLPVILLKANDKIFAKLFSPEVNVAILVLDIFITVTIDALQITTLTIFYLLQKENNEKSSNNI